MSWKEILAACPSPCLLVAVFDVIDRHLVLLGNRRTEVTIANRIRLAASIRVWLRSEVWQITGRAADVLSDLEIGAEVRVLIVVYELLLRDLAAVRERETAVTSYGLSIATCCSLVEITCVAAGIRSNHDFAAWNGSKWRFGPGLLRAPGVGNAFGIVPASYSFLRSSKVVLSVQKDTENLGRKRTVVA